MIMKRHRHYFILTMVLILIMVALFLVGCSPKSTAPAPEEKPEESTTSAPTSTPAEYNWIAVTPFASGHNTNHSVCEFVRLLEERTNGAVKITLYEGTLGDRSEFWDMGQSNTVQFIFTADAHNYARMPITNMVNYPFEVPDPIAASRVLEAWLEAGYLQEVTDHFKVLYFRPLGPMVFFFCDKKVTALEDFNGLKINAVSADQSKTVSALGATAITIPPNDVYMSADRKVIDGLITGIDNAVESKFYEVAKYALKKTLNMGAYMFAMNKETWNSLPPDLQTTIDQIAQEVYTAELQRIENQGSVFWDTFGKNAEVYTISKEEEARWHNAVANVVNGLADEVAAKGYPAWEAMELMRKVVSDYQKSNVENE